MFLYSKETKTFKIIDFQYASKEFYSAKLRGTDYYIAPEKFKLSKAGLK